LISDHSVSSCLVGRRARHSRAPSPLLSIANRPCRLPCCGDLSGSIRRASLVNFPRTLHDSAEWRTCTQEIKPCQQTVPRNAITSKLTAAIAPLAPPQHRFPRVVEAGTESALRESEWDIAPFGLMALFHTSSRGYASSPRAVLFRLIPWLPQPPIFLHPAQSAFVSPPPQSDLSGHCFFDRARFAAVPSLTAQSAEPGHCFQRRRCAPHQQAPTDLEAPNPPLLFLRRRRTRRLSSPYRTCEQLLWPSPSCHDSDSSPRLLGLSIPG